MGQNTKVNLSFVTPACSEQNSWAHRLSLRLSCLIQPRAIWELGASPVTHNWASCHCHGESQYSLCNAQRWQNRLVSLSKHWTVMYPRHHHSMPERSYSYNYISLDVSRNRWGYSANVLDKVYGSISLSNRIQWNKFRGLSVGGKHELSSVGFR